MFECDAKLSSDGVPFLMRRRHPGTHHQRSKVLGAGASAGRRPLWPRWPSSTHGTARTPRGRAAATLDNIARFCLANGYFLNIEIKPTPGH